MCPASPLWPNPYIRTTPALALRLFTIRHFTRQAGFSFIELVMVVLIVGVLSVSVVPRMFNAAEFRERGFSDEVRSALRLAQKSAVAANCPVTFTTTAGAGGGYAAAYTAACPGGATPVPSPKGDAAGLSGAVPDGIAFSAAVAVDFSGAGLRTSAADAGQPTQSITINGGDGRSDVLAVWDTGYIQ